MNAKRFSHAACQHPSTKVARAACRRSMSRTASAPKIESAIITAWNAMKAGPLELTAASVVTVTRENWREFKGQSVTVDFHGVTSVGEITGWSEKNIQIKSVDAMGKSKTQRFPAAHVKSATA